MLRPSNGRRLRCVLAAEAFSPTPGGTCIRQYCPCMRRLSEVLSPGELPAKAPAIAGQRYIIVTVDLLGRLIRQEPAGSSSDEQSLYLEPRSHKTQPTVRYEDRLRLRRPCAGPLIAVASPHLQQDGGLRARAVGEVQVHQYRGGYKDKPTPSKLAMSAFSNTM